MIRFSGRCQIRPGRAFLELHDAKSIIGWEQQRLMRMGQVPVPDGSQKIPNLARQTDPSPEMRTSPNLPVAAEVPKQTNSGRDGKSE